MINQNDRKNKILKKFEADSPSLAPFLQTMFELEMKKYYTLLQDILIPNAPKKLKIHDESQTHISWKYGLECMADSFTSIYEKEQLNKILDMAESNPEMKTVVDAYRQKYWEPIVKGTEKKSSDNPTSIHLLNVKKTYRELVNAHEYITENPDDLFLREGPQLETSVVWQCTVRPLMAAILQFGWIAHKYPSPITKDEWYEAIDLTSTIIAPLTSTKTAIDTELQKATGEIMHMLVIAFAHFIHTIHVLADNSVDHTKSTETAEAEALKEKEKEIESLKLKLEAAEIQAAAMQKKLVEADDAHIRAMAAADRAHKAELREKDRIIAHLTGLVEDEPEPETPAPAPEEILDDVPELDSTECLSLPEENVLFMGGHQNMTKKLAAKYPGWNFISDDKITKDPGKEPEVVFFWVGHASHKLSQNLLNRIPSETPILYVTATNIDLLEAEMKQKYWANQKRSSETEPLV